MAEPVDPDAMIPVELDGETPGYLPATFDILPGALRIRVVTRRQNGQARDYPAAAFTNAGLPSTASRT